MNNNPYQPPKTQLEIEEQFFQNITREGKKQLFIPTGMDLPPRCIKCNAPVTSPIKQHTLYWHKPVYYVLILLHLFIYAIVAFFVRKKVKLSVGLCNHHKTKRRNRIIIALLSVVLIIGVMFFTLANDFIMDFFAILSIALLISLIALVFIMRLVLATKIDDTGFCIKGCGEEFLQSFE